MPDVREYVSVFEDQLRKFLVDEYMNLNIDEFEYAMRVYGTQIVDWGKSLNLSLIRQALDVYMTKRSELSRVEEQKTPVAEIEGPKDADWSETWEKLLQGEIKGAMADLVPYSAIYDWLVKTGYMTPTNAGKWGWIMDARLAEIKKLEIMREGFTATPDEKAMLQRLVCIDWREDQKALGHLIAPSKRVAVMELIKSSKDVKFTEVKNNDNG